MRQIRLFIIAIMLAAFCACAGAEVKADAIPEGRKAADFTLPDQNVKMWTLGDTLKDYKAVILAFYPKDDTGL